MTQLDLVIGRTPFCPATHCHVPCSAPAIQCVCKPCTCAPCRRRTLFARRGRHRTTRPEVSWTSPPLQLFHVPSQRR